MTDQTSTTPSQGKVLWHLTMSLDGFIAGPNHAMDWLSGLSFRPGLVEEMVATTGTILAGRRGYETGLAAAGGKNLEIFGADIARQCVNRGLIDEFYVHLAPVMLGDGIRLLECPGIQPVRWERIHHGDPPRPPRSWTCATGPRAEHRADRRKKEPQREPCSGCQSEAHAGTTRSARSGLSRRRSRFESRR